MFKLSIIGRLGNDAVVKISSRNNQFTSLSVACNCYSQDNRGNKVVKTYWVNVIVFGSYGDLFKTLTKGSLIYAEGEQDIKLFKHSNGNFDFDVTLKATKIEILSKKEIDTKNNEDTYDINE